jgi:Domain of unknown function (DUF4189)
MSILFTISGRAGKCLAKLITQTGPEFPIKEDRVIKYCAPVLVAGVIAAALSSAPPANADVAWVAAAASPSTNNFDFSPGSTSDEAQQRVMDFCNGKYPDCIYVISGQQCVAAAVMNGQAYGGLGATKDVAEQNAEQKGYAATGQTRGEVDAGCVTDW